MVDLLEGAPELVAFGATDAQLARVATADAELTRTATAAARTAGVGSGLITLLTGLAVWGILLVGVPAVHAGRLEGPLLAVLALTPLAVFEMVTGLPAAAQSLQRVRESAARVFDVMDAAPALTSPAGTRTAGTAPARPSPPGARARYGPDRGWALDGVDLDLSPGRRTGVVGPSGAGKSTLAAVLLRFVPYEGSVTLDGTELAEMSAEDVRRVVGLAAQDTHIFDTTLRENLLLARRGRHGGRALSAAIDRSAALDWVEELPAGLGTPLGERGARLSGGQRQRVGIARVLTGRLPGAGPRRTRGTSRPLDGGRSRRRSAGRHSRSDHGDDHSPAGRPGSYGRDHRPRRRTCSPAGHPCTAGQDGWPLRQAMGARKPPDEPSRYRKVGALMLTVDLSRAQFASTTVYHFLFVPITIGLAFFVAIMQTHLAPLGQSRNAAADALFRHFAPN